MISLSALWNVVYRLASVIAIGIALGHSPAWADFSKSRNLDAPGQLSEYPRVGIDREGNSLVVWTDKKAEPHTHTHLVGNAERLLARVKARVRLKDGRLGPVKVLSLGGNWDASWPEVAVNADGQGMVVWKSVNGGQTVIHARGLSTAGELDTMQVVSTPESRELSLNLPKVVIDAAGNALIVWEQNKRARARAISAAGKPGPLETLSGQGEIGLPTVALDGAGNALIAWTTGNARRVQARFRSAAGVRGPIVNISGAGAKADSLGVSTNRKGDALFVWREDGENVIRARFRSAGGTLKSIDTIAAANRGNDGVQVSVRDNGSALLVWVTRLGRKTLTRARVRTAAGALGKVEEISNSFPVDIGPLMSGHTNGDAQIAWIARDFGVLTRTRFSNGTLGAIKTLSLPEAANDIRIAVNTADETIIVWSLLLDEVRIQASVGP